MGEFKKDQSYFLQDTLVLDLICSNFWTDERQGFAVILQISKNLVEDQRESQRIRIGLRPNLFLTIRPDWQLYIFYTM